jgi:hypothetical protein
VRRVLSSRIVNIRGDQTVTDGMGNIAISVTTCKSHLHNKLVVRQLEEWISDSSAMDGHGTIGNRSLSAM